VSAKEIPAEALGLPRFELRDGAEAAAFGLSSHARAREALEFGLGIDDQGFNIFVLGDDRSGRMTATLDFLQGQMRQRPTPPDWVYLNNFRFPERPRPYRLPPGIGRRFRDRMTELVPQLRAALVRALSSEDFQDRLRGHGDAIRTEAQQRFAALRDRAQGHGLDIVQTEQGAMVVPAQPQGAAAGSPPPPAPAVDTAAAKAVVDGLAQINRWVAERQAEFIAWQRDLARQIADQAVGALIDQAVAEFSAYAGLARWLTEMRVDLLDNLQHFLPQTPEAAAAIEETERRYAVNLLVDHSDEPHASVVLEANPTYANLFGRIDYRQVQGTLRTDFTLIRAGSLHRANGGVLVLRAEAVASDPVVWTFLKGALRDREIRVEELHRSGNVPIAGAPRPKPIPLDVKVVLVGNPRWYYAFFALDPDFQTYFKVKSDIDADMEATPENLATYAGLIRGMGQARGNLGVAPAALGRLLGIAARWSGQRDKLTARFEQIEDLVSEAASFARARAAGEIVEDDVIRAQATRRRRNSSIEDRVQEQIRSGLVMIDATGTAVGQINALTVREAGDHTFGAPSRVTARAAIGRRGIINIERDVELGGPIQQKGALVIQGWLAGTFARATPLSCSVSVTFEQSYGGVEGDSASLAELIAILSDLSGVPLRQDLAVTGSVNQHGLVQAIGGVRHKIEGFYRVCAAAGPLTGAQGVVVPAANERHLLLRDDIVAAVAAGQFHVYSVTTVEQAVALFTGQPVDARDAGETWTAESVYGRVAAQLRSFNRLLGPARTEDGALG